MVNEAAPSFISACHHRLESQFFGFLAKELLEYTVEDFAHYNLSVLS